MLDRGDTAPDWGDVLSDVDEGRRTAIASGSVQSLARWVDPEGDAWRADSALAARVRDLRATLAGGALEVLDIRPESVSAAVAVLLVRDRRTTYTISLPGTASPVTVPSRSPRWWRVSLRLAGAQWRVRSVATVDAPTAPASTRSAPPTSRAP